MSSDRDDIETWEDVYDRPDPRFELEVPVAGKTWLLDGPDVSTPETVLEGLMRAAPNEPPGTSTEQKHAMADRLIELMETELDDNERAVLEATVIAGHSIRRASALLGLPRSTVHRIHHSALERLRRLA